MTANHLDDHQDEVDDQAEQQGEVDRTDLGKVDEEVQDRVRTGAGDYRLDQENREQHPPLPQVPTLALREQECRVAGGAEG